jgi:hypothetical protein
MSGAQDKNLSIREQQRALFRLVAKRGLYLLLIFVLVLSLWTYAAGRVDLSYLIERALQLAAFNAPVDRLSGHYYIAPGGDDANDGLAANRAFATIQKALHQARPGDTIHLAPGAYEESITTEQAGQPDAPITIIGPAAAILRGDGEHSTAFLIKHDYYTLVGFTIDGLHGDAQQPSGYTDKLLYVQGSGKRQGVTGLKVLHMTLMNAGGECLRLRYFAQHNEVAYSTILNCGRYDYQFDDGGKNGEAIYIGTSSSQWEDGKNPTTDPDASTYNWIHHNTINTQGNECVDIKEGAHTNVIEYNTCTGQLDPESGGFDTRGDRNVFRFNTVYGNVGAGVRLGGHEVNGIQYGVNNQVYGNQIYGNNAGGINIAEGPQERICGNVLDANGDKAVFGSFGKFYDPTSECER